MQLQMRASAPRPAHAGHGHAAAHSPGGKPCSATGGCWWLLHALEHELHSMPARSAAEAHAAAKS